MVAQGGDVLLCPVQASTGVDLPGKARKYGLFFFPPSSPLLQGRDPQLGLLIGSCSQRVVSAGIEHDELAGAGVTACADLGLF